MGDVRRLPRTSRLEYEKGSLRGLERNPVRLPSLHSPIDHTTGLIVRVPDTLMYRERLMESVVHSVLTSPVDLFSLSEDYGTNAEVDEVIHGILKTFVMHFDLDDDGFDENDNYLFTEYTVVAYLIGTRSLVFADYNYISSLVKRYGSDSFVNGKRVL